MKSKTFKIVGNDISDGYHTFDELYDHRCFLWILLCTSGAMGSHCKVVHEHFPGWDLIIADAGTGQVSYHVPMKYREYYDELPVIKDGEQNYDGHTSADVLTRIKELLL